MELPKSIYVRNIMKHSQKIQKTKILPLRWFANALEPWASSHLLKCVWLDEEAKYGFKYRYHGFMWRVLNWPYKHWGTYYTLDMAAWAKELNKDELMERLGSDYDEHGVPYWEKTGTIDPDER